MVHLESYYLSTVDSLSGGHKYEQKKVSCKSLHAYLQINIKYIGKLSTAQLILRYHKVFHEKHSLPAFVTSKRFYFSVSRNLTKWLVRCLLLQRKSNQLHLWKQLYCCIDAANNNSLLDIRLEIENKRLRDTKRINSRKSCSSNCDRQMVNENIT